MIERLVFHELPLFSQHAVLTNNAISSAFDEENAQKVCQRLSQWLNIEQVDSINISFKGLASSPAKLNIVAAFSSMDGQGFGGVSVGDFFANHLVNTATKNENGIVSDFDRGFLGVLFADLADNLFASSFPGTQVFLDPATIKVAARNAENYGFVFELTIQERSDYILLHLPSTWKVPEVTIQKNVKSDLRICFPIIAGFIPMTIETINQCSPGDLLIPDHAIQKNDITPTHPYAQIQLSDKKMMNVELSFDSEKWICTFLNKDLSMDDSITTLLVDNAELNIRIIAGNVEVPLKELSEIQPGYTLELDRAVHEGVQLEVNGQVFANGELVNVGGKLGVRILSRTS